MGENDPAKPKRHLGAGKGRLGGPVRGPAGEYRRNFKRSQYLELTRGRKSGFKFCEYRGPML